MPGLQPLVFCRNSDELWTIAVTDNPHLVGVGATGSRTWPSRLLCWCYTVLIVNTFKCSICRISYSLGYFTWYAFTLLVWLCTAACKNRPLNDMCQVGRYSVLCQLFVVAFHFTQSSVFPFNAVLCRIIPYCILFDSCSSAKVFFRVLTCALFSLFSRKIRPAIICLSWKFSLRRFLEYKTAQLAEFRIEKYFTIK